MIERALQDDHGARATLERGATGRQLTRGPAERHKLEGDKKVGQDEKSKAEYRGVLSLAEFVRSQSRLEQKHLSYSKPRTLMRVGDRLRGSGGKRGGQVFHLRILLLEVISVKSPGPIAEGSTFA